MTYTTKQINSNFKISDVLREGRRRKMKKVINTLAVIGVIASIMMAGGAMDSDKMLVAFIFVGVAGVMVLVANRTQDDN